VSDGALQTVFVTDLDSRAKFWHNQLNS